MTNCSAERRLVMEWHPRASYRNGRFYSEGQSPPGPVSNIRLTIAWMLLILRQRLAKLAMQPRRGSQAAILFKSGDSRGFTVLGARSEHGSTMVCPFPQRDLDEGQLRSAPGVSAQQIDRWADEGGAVAASTIKEPERCSQH
jgi:hypothetical protein